MLGSRSGPGRFLLLCAAATISKFSLPGPAKDSGVVLRAPKRVPLIPTIAATGGVIAARHGSAKCARSALDLRLFVTGRYGRFFGPKSDPVVSSAANFTDFCVVVHVEDKIAVGEGTLDTLVHAGVGTSGHTAESFEAWLMRLEGRGIDPSTHCIAGADGGGDDGGGDRGGGGGGATQPDTPPDGTTGDDDSPNGADVVESSHVPMNDGELGDPAAADDANVGEPGVAAEPLGTTATNPTDTAGGRAPMDVTPKSLQTLADETWTQVCDHVGKYGKFVMKGRGSGAALVAFSRADFERDWRGGLPPEDVLPNVRATLVAGSTAMLSESVLEAKAARLACDAPAPTSQESVEGAESVEDFEFDEGVAGVNAVVLTAEESKLIEALAAASADLTYSYISGVVGVALTLGPPGGWLKMHGGHCAISASFFFIPIARLTVQTRPLPRRQHALQPRFGNRAERERARGLAAPELRRARAADAVVRSLYDRPRRARRDVLRSYFDTARAREEPRASFIAGS